MFYPHQPFAPVILGLTELVMFSALATCPPCVSSLLTFKLRSTLGSDDPTFRRIPHPPSLNPIPVRHVSLPLPKRTAPRVRYLRHTGHVDRPLKKLRTQLDP
ncbi:hypothetical protein V6N11_023988 [Hibiscus sabdariffa]|uniref:Secreted protein n=1 Tax=Hibiscus sabdariffa TaxID=183260 RepID=A0ABR2TP82_9ROSI